MKGKAEHLNEPPGNEPATNKRVSELQLDLSRYMRAEQVNRSIFEAMPGGIVHVSMEGAILNANLEARRLLGYSYDDLTHRYTVDWSPETIREDGTPFPLEEYPASRTLATGRAAGPETIGVRRPDGELFWAVFRAVPVREVEDGKVTGAVVTFIDVTAEKELIHQLKNQERDLANLIDNIPHYIVRYTRAGEIVFVNRVDENTNEAEVLGRSIYEYHPPEKHALVRARVERILDSGVSEAFEDAIEINGKTMYYHIVMWRAERNGEYLIDSISTDITHLRILNEKLQFQATHDSLTLLANRFQFEQDAIAAIEAARAQGRHHALLYLDLDQFKIVNDTCGHAAGDELLRRLAGELKQSLPENGMIARLGGDEFGILLYDTDEEGALQNAHAIRTVVEQFRFFWDERLFRVGVSIGVALIDDGNQDFARILRDADFACFAAKDAGRNQVHLFTAENDQLTNRRGEMLTVGNLTAALEEDAFQLYYQRVVPLNRDDAGLSFEILLRLRGANDRAFNTSLLIGAAERYDLMGRVDRWVVRNTLDWLEKNPRIADEIDFLSINLSGKSLGDERFQLFCRRLFAELSVPLSKLRFEITETAAVANPELTRVFIHDLRTLGIRFALDDFGSGLSSFEYLRNLPIDLLKIDGSFVRRIHLDHIDYSMVKSIHGLASSMEIKTVAEFVENGEILNLLSEIGIDYAQGYFLHKPEPLNGLGASAGPAN